MAAGGDAGRYWYDVLVVPSETTAFVAQARTRAAVVALVASARRTPGTVVVPPTAAGQDLAAARAVLEGYSVDVKTVPGFSRAGSVIRSVPAFGTPLARGAAVTLTVSSGLGEQQAMSDAFLARHGVRIEPLGTLTAAEREVVDRTRPSPPAASPWASQVVLRRITSEFPSRNGVPEVQHRLVWLSLTPHELVEPLGGPCCSHRGPPAGVGRDISVYDARTGKFLTGQSF